MKRENVEEEGGGEEIDRTRVERTGGKEEVRKERKTEI